VTASLYEIERYKVYEGLPTGAGDRSKMAGVIQAKMKQVLGCRGS
jgi:hypothetical protein